MTKTFKTRDAATAALRKAGINRANYHLHYAFSNGAHTVDFDVAPTKLVPTEKETCSSFARRLLVAGFSNHEVFDELQRHYQLDDKKRSYPAWYRWELKRKGVIANVRVQ